MATLAGPAGPATASPVEVSVVVCCYTDARWDDLAAALESLAAQERAPYETIVVVDHNPPLATRVRELWPAVDVIENPGPRGLSSARNAGVARATGGIVAFLDDDAVASPDWISAMQSLYVDTSVIGAGGLVAPRWPAARPGWFPEEFDWVVGCTYRGLPTARAQVRNPIGANMSARADALRAVGGFRADLGRVGTIPLGAEETELFVRIADRYPDASVLFDPAARVSHRVTRERATYRYYLRRCFGEGLSKARMARISGARRALRTELRYTAVILPLGMTRGLGAVLRGDWAGPARSVMIAAGLGATVAGYVRGRLSGAGEIGEAQADDRERREGQR